MTRTISNAPWRPSPAWMLVIAALFWGTGFTWAKQAGDAINAAAGMGPGAMLGPMVGLTIRFSLATVLWLIVFPRSRPSRRNGWTRGTLWRGGLMGLLLAAAVLVQHMGLAQSSAATIAFLTNLTVVIVPLMVAVALRRLPGVRLIAAVLIAVAGIWLLTGAKRAAPTVGELYGAACAVLFAVELVMLNVLVPGDDPVRLTPILFGVTAIAAGAIAFLSPGFSAIDWGVFHSPALIVELGLLTLLTTFLSFGLMTVYQPRVTATKAALVYLMEPIFAAAYAWIAAGDAMTGPAIAGATMIIAANLLVPSPGNPGEGSGEG